MVTNVGKNLLIVFVKISSLSVLFSTVKDIYIKKQEQSPDRPGWDLDGLKQTGEGVASR